MPLGLDLRGGLYLLYQVDVNAAVAQALEGYAQDARRALAAANIPVKDVTSVAVGADRPNAVRVVLAPEADVGKAKSSLTSAFQGLTLSTESLASGSAITGVLTTAQIRERQDYAIQQNITTLRNRVNELGVSEPIVQRQGIDRINVQLPGVQNSPKSKTSSAAWRRSNSASRTCRTTPWRRSRPGARRSARSSIRTRASAGRCC
jgi:preprotein translocase subunit SecD